MADNELPHLYANQVGVSMSEMGRLDFFEVINEKSSVVVKIALHIEVMRDVYKTMGKTIRDYDEMQAKTKATKQTNKALS
jgi:hypothetical protein